jgi:malate dehydrogenase (oxaloacetate-decarboxylating)
MEAVKSERSINEIAMEKHGEWQGKLEVVSRAPLNTKEDLSAAYTPGVAAPCLAIKDDPELSYQYTRRGNMVAVVTDGTAVLGLGDIGGLAGMPVMEGKCVLFKAFGGVDAIPICVKSKDPDDIVRTVELIADSFGGINLEDISAPRCFEIEQKLKERLSIPVFHDDQHGTAIVVTAGLINAFKLTGKRFDSARIVIIGAGSAGIAIAKLLMRYGAKDIVMVGRNGIFERGKTYDNSAKTEIAAITNPNELSGSLADAMNGADVIIGVSQPGLITAEMVASMADKSVVFALSNPTPEIMPDIAKSAGAYIVGTGRSDFPNQINNLLAFPGVFRGALSVRAKAITEEMKLAAAEAIAGMVSAEQLSPDYIIPSALDKSVALAVAQAVANAAQDGNNAAVAIPGSRLEITNPVSMLHVGDDAQINCNGNIDKLSAGDNLSINCGNVDKLSTGDNAEFNCGNVDKLSVGDNAEINCGNVDRLTVGGNSDVSCGNVNTLTVDGNSDVNCGNVNTLTVDGNSSVSCGNVSTLTTEDNCEIHCNDVITLATGESNEVHCNNVNTIFGESKSD